MRVSFSFDTEDYITPPEVGLDDLLKTLAETLTEAGLKGTFFLIGEKARCLRDRGRRDVIEALRRNDVGSHVNMGSIHPTVTERMERANWSDGVARMLADEAAGTREIAEIVGAPVRSLARHGGSYSPQLVAALGRMSVAYVNSPSELPGRPITWYCNALNFRPCCVSFQDSYFTRESFLAMEQRFFAEVEARRDCGWLGIFHSHPCRIKMTRFGCRNYYNGVYTPPEEWLVADVREDFTLDGLRENFAFHCRRLREDPRFTVMSFSELADEYGRQAEAAEAGEIGQLARRAAETDEPFWSDRFSAAEIVDLLARAYLHRSRRGSLPESLPRRDVVGPTQTPLAAPTARKLTAEALRRVARGVDTAVEFSGVAPSRIRCGEGTLGSMGEVGLGSAMAALGQALASTDAEATVETRVVAPYPPEGDAIADRARAFRNWNPHRRDLDMADILRLTALQSWTLKPAWPGEPLAAS